MLKNQYFLLLLITILIALISFGLAGYVQIVTSRPTTLSMAKPSYLLAPIPTISELEVILKNPKLKEMKSISIFLLRLWLAKRADPTHLCRL